MLICCVVNRTSAGTGGGGDEGQTFKSICVENVVKRILGNTVGKLLLMTEFVL